MVMDFQGGTEAQQYVWGGAIPLQIHLHDSEVTTIPPAPPAFILAPWLGYLPLLIPQIKPFFSSSLPPGVDTVWFEYKGLPLKWYIPTGVLFDLLCAEPERPWNLTVHFRGYPGNILTPCEGEDGVKWSFINALKEAAYIINGNCKNVMNMSQSDQAELWRSVLNGIELCLEQLEVLNFGNDFSLGVNSSTPRFRRSISDSDTTATTRTGRVPVRLYVRYIDADIDVLDDASTVDSWEKVSYVNHPFELHGEVKALLPELFTEESLIDANTCEAKEEGGQCSEDGSSSRSPEEAAESLNGSAGLQSDGAEIKLIRIQGIEPKLEIPFGWVVNNLMNPEHYLHMCVYVKVVEPVLI